MPRTSRLLTLAAGAREAMSGIRRFRVRNTVRAISPNCSSSSACKRSSGPTTGSPVRLGRLKGREPCAIKKTATTAPAQSAMASCTERWRKRSVAQLRGPVGVVLGSVATFLSIMVPPCVWRLTVDIPSTLLKIVLCTHGACQAVPGCTTGLLKPWGQYVRTDKDGKMKGETEADRKSKEGR